MSLNFIHNFFKGLWGKLVVCLACIGTYLKKVELAMTSRFFFLYFFHLNKSPLVASTIMAPPLNATQHILIETLLKEGFETKQIA